MVDEPQLGRVEVSSSALAFTRSVDEVAHVSPGGQARHSKRVDNVVTVVGAQTLSETIDEGLELVLGQVALLPEAECHVGRSWTRQEA